MILTGTKIAQEVASGAIVISPFVEKQLNPNSYNYRIGDRLIAFDPIAKRMLTEISIPSEGYILQPHTMYLASTFETLGSDKYAMSLIGRSSMGRLGLFLQLSANLGHTGSIHKWTLELVCTKPLKIYPGMIIGQISFWSNQGSISPYDNGYNLFDAPTQSKLKEHNQ